MLQVRGTLGVVIIIGGCGGRGGGGCGGRGGGTMPGLQDGTPVSQQGPSKQSVQSQ